MEPNTQSGNEIPSSDATGSASVSAVSASQSSAGSGSPDRRSLLEKGKDGARDRVTSAVTTGTTTASVALSSVAQSLLASSHDLREQQHGASDLVGQAAQGIERVAKYLESTDPSEIARNTESWARRNPALFLGGAFVLGVLGARFLKSSASRIEEPSNASPARAGFSDREVATPVVAEEG
jgi:hypothetical protein